MPDFVVGAAISHYSEIRLHRICHGSIAGGEPSRMPDYAH
jgi:hypothetical protein